MAKIKTCNGVYKFKQIDLYAGIKRIDKETSKKNLLEIKLYIDEANIHWGLAYGTLLGAVRESDFIDHDEDIDLFMLESDEIKLKNILFILRDKGFELIRHDRRGLYSFMKEGEYIDFYVFKPLMKGVCYCGTDFILERHLKETILIDFFNEKFMVPRDYKECLALEYGNNWDTPIQYFNYTKPKLKIFKEKILVRVKRSLPVFLYDRLQYRYSSSKREAFLKATSDKI